MTKAYLESFLGERLEVEMNEKDTPTDLIRKAAQADPKAAAVFFEGGVESVAAAFAAGTTTLNKGTTEFAILTKGERAATLDITKPIMEQLPEGIVIDEKNIPTFVVTASTVAGAA